MDLLVILVVLLVAAALGYWWMFMKKKKGGDAGGAQSAQAEQTVDMGGEKTATPATDSPEGNTTPNNGGDNNQNPQA